MQKDRSAPLPAGVARPDSPQFEHQRRLLLELAVDPPAGGDTVAVLAARLALTPPEIETAAAGLERAGAVERRAGALFATPAVRAVDVLWPLG